MKKQLLLVLILLSIVLILATIFPMPSIINGIVIGSTLFSAMIILIAYRLVCK